MSPSSHSSPMEKMPSPQPGGLQATVHASSLLSLASSQVSLLLGCVNPSPQKASLHIDVQSAVSAFWSPSSHCSSLLACANPSPHLGSAHELVQVPVSLFIPPSSHSSVEPLPANSRPSPQLGGWHKVVQVPMLSSLRSPSSHS